MKENGDQGNFIYPYSATDTGVEFVYYSFYVVAVSKREMGGGTPPPLLILWRIAKWPVPTSVKKIVVVLLCPPPPELGNRGYTTGYAKAKAGEIR